MTAYPRSPEDVITPWMVETIQRLKDRQINVEVLAPSYRAIPTQLVDGVLVHRFRYAPSRWETLTHDQTVPDRLRDHPLQFALLPGYLLAGALAAVRLVRTRGFDLVHAFWPLPHGFFGLAAKSAAGVPLVCTFFGVELTWTQSRFPFLRPAVRLLVRSSDALTVISSYTAAELKRVCPDAQPTIIPFGSTVDAPRSVVAPSVQPSTPYQLLFVGRLVERKGVHVLLHAAARLPCEHPIAIHVVGDGPERARLEDLAADLGIGGQVHFHGFVTRDVLMRRLAGCFALILPAVIDEKGDTEGLGVVLLEALSYSKPVIASEAGGIGDVVRHRENGLLVPPGDVEALAEAICAYTADPTWAASMGAAGRNYVERAFSWDVILDRLEHVYRSSSGKGRH